MNGKTYGASKWSGIKLISKFGKPVNSYFLSLFLLLSFSFEVASVDDF